MDARVALTLRTVGGLSTREIARAFLVAASRPWPSGSCERRRRSARPASPTACRRASCSQERLDGVLAVLYLVFNEGYSATSGDDLVRVDLCDEAIWLDAHGRPAAARTRPRCGACSR